MQARLARDGWSNCNVQESRTNVHDASWRRSTSVTVPSAYDSNLVANITYKATCIAFRWKTIQKTISSTINLPAIECNPSTFVPKIWKSALNTVKMSKLITVFGATGNQGGSVIKHILADPTLSKAFTIRGITRDVSKPAAQALADQGVELRAVSNLHCLNELQTDMIQADLSDKSSVTEALEGSDTVFLVTNYWESASYDVEFEQGKNVADACKELGVKHLIFSSLLHVGKVTNSRLTHVPHFESKADVEEYIKKIGVPASFYLPGYFMSNFNQSIQKGEDGSLSFGFPVGKDSKFPLIDVAQDTGK